MSENLNSVVGNIVIGGKKISCLHLRLEQEFNAHHKFEILLNYRSFENKWMESPGQILAMTGEEVMISLLHKETGAENTFIGIVTKVTYVGNAGVRNQLLISGGSPTILMDGKPTMDSFTDKTLRDIVADVVAASGDGLEVKVKPVFTSGIDYLCQYEESCFDFLNRLSWLYGEWFYYDGRNIFFGKPEKQEYVDLTYNANLSDMELSAQLMPAQFKRYDYLVHECSEISYTSQDDDVDVVGYAKLALGKSLSLYKSVGTLPADAPVSSKGDLEQLVKVEKNRSVAKMLYLKGRSVTCALGIGKTVRLKLPKNMAVEMTDVDSFIVQKVTHIIDGAGQYHNEFVGFVSDIENIPMEMKHFPEVGPQLATVTNNEDSKGRVKVQMQWQQMLGKETNWIRVQTPDAGSSDKGPRGTVFIPEVGDQVMIGFERNDPSRPYVAGSLFPENIGTGGGTGNTTKTLTTRSGNQVRLDDKKGDVTIVDQSGNNLIIIDGKDKITITSTKTIQITNGKSFLNIEEDSISISAKNIGLNGEEEIICKSGDEVFSVAASGEVIGISGTGKTVCLGAKETMGLNAGKSMDLQSKALSSKGSDTNVIEGGIVKINS